MCMVCICVYTHMCMVCVCVYTGVYGVCVCVYTGVYGVVCIDSYKCWGQRSLSDAFFSCCPSQVWGQGLSLTLVFTHLLDRLASELWGSTCLCPSFFTSELGL